MMNVVTIQQAFNNSCLSVKSSIFLNEEPNNKIQITNNFQISKLK